MFVYGMLNAILGNGPISAIKYDLLLTVIFQEDVFTVQDMYPLLVVDCMNLTYLLLL
jgi:hypothetical protein